MAPWPRAMGEACAQQWQMPLSQESQNLDLHAKKMVPLKAIIQVV